MATAFGVSLQSCVAISGRAGRSKRQGNVHPLRCWMRSNLAEELRT
jgi:hypothetical protein